MTISEDRIMKHLDFHLTHSEPGEMLHSLSVLSAPLAATNALGLIDESKIRADITMIAPVGDVAEPLIASAMLRLMSEAAEKQELILFAALTQEAWVLPRGAPERELGRRLIAEGGQLGDHPAAVEVTIIYAAIRDGRRWRGRRYLTGSQAGTTEEVELLVGRPQRGESRGISTEHLIRRMVGLR